jgi:prevent-host-death family protein
MRRWCSITEARRSLAAIVREVEMGIGIELTCRGTPVAAMARAQDYERM